MNYNSLLFDSQQNAPQYNMIFSISVRGGGGL